MNIWHDISEKRITTRSFEAFIEIPKGCKAKYELDKETGFCKTQVKTQYLHLKNHKNMKIFAKNGVFVSRETVF